MAEKNKRKNPFEGMVNYFKDVRGELKKVVWPTYKQVQNNTIIVLISILIVGIFIWVLDFGFVKTLGTVTDKYNVSNKSEATTGSQLPGGIQIPGQVGGAPNQPATGSQSNGQ